MFSIVASDLDGTLLNTEHSIAPYSQSILQRLDKQGKLFVFATGRNYIDVARMRDKIGIPAYMITSNGARIHDANDKLIFSQDLLPEQVTAVLDIVKDDSLLSIHMYHEGEWLINRTDQDFTPHHKESGFKHAHFDINNPPKENVSKIFFIVYDTPYLQTYEQKLKEAFGDSVSIAFSTRFCLEVMGAGVSKGAALEAVAKINGMTLDDCIAFGDGMNDVEMLLAAKKGLVMANADERVKAALPNNEVIGSNADEAVAHYLEDNLL